MFFFFALVPLQSFQSQLHRSKHLSRWGGHRVTFVSSVWEFAAVVNV